jgi:3-aminobutyryl-CoA ammonia-lyase
VALQDQNHKIGGDAGSSSPADEPARGTASVRLRLSPLDARYADGLVAGAKVMEIFGDLATEIAIRDGGEEGLCVAYESVEFKQPLRAGDFIEASARVVSVGRTSRAIEATLHKVIAARGDGSAAVLDPPLLAARARGTVVLTGSIGTDGSAIAD